MEPLRQISSSVVEIKPTFIVQEGSVSDSDIIPNRDIKSSFNPDKDTVELYVYDFNKTIVSHKEPFSGWTVDDTAINKGDGSVEQVVLNPDTDVISSGYSSGRYYTYYNFIEYELGCSPNNSYYIDSISSNRTEVSLKSNFITKEETLEGYNSLKDRLNSSEYFDEFYIKIPDNRYFVGINVQYTGDTIFVKLYEPLPDNVNVKQILTVVTKVAESKAYQVDLSQTINKGQLDEIVNLRYANVNLDLQDDVSNSTEYLNRTQLQGTSETGSYQRLQNILNQKGITIPADYTDFSTFIHYSSAERRIQNFYNKVSLIQGYYNDLDTINSITGSTSQSLRVSESREIINGYIEDIVSNFDDYENYMFYESNSFAYPKSSSLYPYELYPTGSTEVLEWLGSDDESSGYYGGRLLTASLYDNRNQDYLWWSVPEFIRENSDNEQYHIFVDMIGHHFDTLWLYTKGLTDKLNNTNELDEGASLDIVSSLVESFGYRIKGSGLDNYDNFISLIGVNPSGGYLPPTGSELITDYIAVNSGSNYNSEAFPYPIQKVKQELYKRLYHNMPYLVRKKGTTEGLRQLINIWGIPSTILRISEFGGKDKDNSDDYDYWYQRYSKAFHTQNSSSVVVPWLSSERNRITDGEYAVPDSIMFRFKPDGRPTTAAYLKQPLVVKKTQDFSDSSYDFFILLAYSGSGGSGSYSGSVESEYANYGGLEFRMSGSEGDTLKTDLLNLPYYNGDWWSVMITRNTHSYQQVDTNVTTYTLYAKSCNYNGYDGAQITYEGSQSFTIDTTAGASSSYNASWNRTGSTDQAAAYFGGFPSGTFSFSGNGYATQPFVFFSGAFQDIRYYSRPATEAMFDDYVMNPQSIEGINYTGSESSFDTITFRAALGNELEDDITTTTTASHTQSFTSIHPAITASAPNLITGSFYNTTTAATESSYYILFQPAPTQSHTIRVEQTYFADQPSVGVRNRVTDRIWIDTGSFYGTVLHSQKSMQQDYQVSRSYSPPINSLEVALSPQNEISDDITAALGYGAIASIIADPRQISESTTRYNGLDKIAEDYFNKYYKKPNLYDYIRLVDFIDTSLFKAIKEFVPARTSVSTGIVIKQHLLERNRVRPPQVTFSQSVYTGSITQGIISAGAGGVVNKYNNTNFSQSWIEYNVVPTGAFFSTHSNQEEFYNGKYSGSFIQAAPENFNSGNMYLTRPTSSTLDSSLYKNSEFNPLINNASVQRTSSFLKEADFASSQNGATNITTILAGTADGASVPDYHYTSKKITGIRYDGIRLQSADYNKYTANTSSYITFGGDSISWGGDISYGKSAVIDRNPKFIAHFKKSYESREVSKAMSFEIDSLIEIPYESIANKPYSPSSISVNGDNSRLYEVINSIKNRRKVAVSYDSYATDVIDLSSLRVDSYKVYESAIKYKTICTNQKTVSTAWLTSSFYRQKEELLTIEEPDPEVIQMVTGSGQLILSGSRATINYFISSSNTPATAVLLTAPNLANVNTYNSLLNNEIYSGGLIGSTVYMFVKRSDNNDNDNYIRYNSSASYLGQYTETETPMLIKRGDEIRVNYLGGSSGTDFYEQVFTVTSVESRSVLNSNQWAQCDDSTCYANGLYSTGNVYDSVKVYPDPSTLSNPIPEGNVYTYTIRRRVESDTSVVLTLTPPPNSEGVLTPTGGGFLVPEDLTSIQKENVLNIINTLRGSNSFTS